MPDKTNVLKICAILAAGALSLTAASRSAESYAAEAAAKEKTLAEALLQSQLKEQLEKAEEKLKNELTKQEITIVTTVMETKPPVTTPPETTTSETTTTAPPETTPPETEPPETTAPVTAPPETTAPETEPPEEIVTEFTRGGILPTDRTGIKSRSMFSLKSDERTKIMYFLIDHYFLDGYVYAENEARPALKEKKRLAAQMENSVIKSFNLILGSVSASDITSVMSADFGSIRAEAEALRDEFRGSYANAADYGEQFAALYSDSLSYFDRLIAALKQVEDVVYQYNNAANPLIALSIITNAMDDVIIPEIMGVLEQSFDLVEVTQEIFLEGTQGTKLLSREEVRDIVANPGLALYVINNGI